jgi:hypothetical protein
MRPFSWLENVTQAQICRREIMIRHFQAAISGSFRRSVATGLMMLAAMLMATPAGAQELDPNSPPPANDYVSCGHFQTQADAQEVLDYGNLDELGRQSLDGDGDGIACEDAFLDPDSPPPARDYTSCGHFESQEGAQAALDSGLLDELGVQSLDGDGDGIACEDAFASAPDAEVVSAPATGVTSLPRTGTGPADGASDDTGALVLALVLMSGGALTLRRRLTTS